MILYRRYRMKKVILPSIFLAVLSTPAFEKVIHAEENESTLAVSNQVQYVKVNSGNLILKANASLHLYFSKTSKWKK